MILGIRKLQIRMRGPVRVNRDSTHVEHNESAHPPIADMKADIDFCRSGPSAIKMERTTLVDRVAVRRRRIRVPTRRANSSEAEFMALSKTPDQAAL
jgi:hypothetical protein